MFFRVPYYSPPFDPGVQITNLQMGGPSSHPREQATKPQVWPLVYGLQCMGIGNMPRQIIGPTAPIVPNELSNAQLQMQIAGLFKSPIATPL